MAFATSLTFTKSRICSPAVVLIFLPSKQFAMIDGAKRVLPSPSPKTPNGRTVISETSFCFAYAVVKLTEETFEIAYNDSGLQSISSVRRTLP